MVEAAQFSVFYGTEVGFGSKEAFFATFARSKTAQIPRRHAQLVFSHLHERQAERRQQRQRQRGCGRRCGRWVGPGEMTGGGGWEVLFGPCNVHLVQQAPGSESSGLELKCHFTVKRHLMVASPDKKHWAFSGARAGISFWPRACSVGSGGPDFVFGVHHCRGALSKQVNTSVQTVSCFYAFGLLLVPKKGPVECKITCFNLKVCLQAQPEPPAPPAPRLPRVARMAALQPSPEALVESRTPPFGGVIEAFGCFRL